MKKYTTEQPEKGRVLKFTVEGNTFNGSFDGINFKSKDNSYSVLRYDVEWEYFITNVQPPS